MESAALEQQLGYWKKQLAGMEVTAIASDRRKPGVARHHGAAERLMTSSETRRRLKDLALEHNATLFMVVLAALQVVLHSRTGSVDLSLGTDIANRNRREIEGLIGFFVNTLVLRTSLKGDPPFSDLIERVRETTLGAYTNQDLPFERLVEELRPRRDGGHSPLFRIKVTLGNIPIRATGMHGLQLSLLPPADTIAASDMTFFLGEDEEGISISLVYDADLFEAATAKTVLLGLESVISAVADSPELRVSDLLEHLKEREAQHAQQLQKALESVVYGKLKFRRNPAVPLPSPLPEEKKNDPSRTGRSPEGPV
jgi:non-ribosomal peptide synthetase component F